MEPSLRPTDLALARAQANLIDRLEQLEKKRSDGEDTAVGIEYAALSIALALIGPLTNPGATRVMTTEELAIAFHLKPRTARRKGLKGELPVAPIRLGGPRAKIRWAATR
jgi:hypothetical protein